MGELHIFCDKPLNVEKGFKGKNFDGYCSDCDLCYLSFSFMIFINNTKFQAMMHGIQSSFHARFGNTLNELLFCPTIQLYIDSFIVSVIYNKPLRRNSYEVVSACHIRNKEG